MKILSLQLNSYSTNLLQIIIASLIQSLKEIFQEGDIKFTDNSYSFIPICLIKKDDLSFVAMKDLGTLTLKFDESNWEVVGQ